MDKKPQPIINYLVTATRTLINHTLTLSKKVDMIEEDLGDSPTYEGLNKKINAIREELDGLRIHYQSTLKEIEELRKPKKKVYNKYIS